MCLGIGPSSDVNADRLEAWAMDLISTADAAERLGITERQVRRLAAAGELSARRVGGRWLIDAKAVRHRSRSDSRPGRPLSPSMAWTVLAATSAVFEPDAKGSRQEAPSIEDRRARYRLRALLADAPPSRQWNKWLRHRADARRVWVHPGVVDRLARDHRLHPAGRSVVAASGLGIATGDRNTFYVDENVVDQVLADYRAHFSDEGQVVMMVVPTGVRPAALGEPGSPVNLAAALVDLLASSDARERHAAVSALDSARQAFVAGPAGTASSS